MKNDDAGLLDILHSARSIREYLAGASIEQFMADQQRQDAVNRRFEIIGEAARRLSEATRAAFPQIPWRLTSAMRNVLIHDYDDVDLKVVWDTAQRDLPTLITALEAHVAKLTKPSSDSSAQSS